MFSCFRFVTNQRKNIPPEMTILGMRVLHNFQCTFSAAIYCICDLYLILMDMTIALKSLNEMQQTASMRLTIIRHDITVIYVTFKCITIQCSNIFRLRASKRSPRNEVCRL